MAHNFRATDIAWAIPVNTAMERYVLLALAAYANDGFTCYPSVSRLSELTKLDAKTVRRALRGLESVGAIEITASPVHGSNIYRIRQKPTPTESGRGVLPDPAGGTTRSGTTRSGRGVLPDPVGGYYQIRQGGTTRSGTQTYKGTDKETNQGTDKEERARAVDPEKPEPENPPKKRTGRKPFTPPEVGQPGGIDPAIWRDWLTQRGAKAPVTATAWKLFAHQCERIPCTLEEGVLVCIAAGWRSINASWSATRERLAEVRGEEKAPKDNRPAEELTAEDLMRLAGNIPDADH